jgi:hypothetical protein
VTPEKVIAEGVAEGTNETKHGGRLHHGFATVSPNGHPSQEKPIEQPSPFSVDPR